MKKNEKRFTIEFNLIDPRHRKAVEILNAVGRSKAIIIADALWEYYLNHNKGKRVDDSNLDKTLAVKDIQDEQGDDVDNDMLKNSINESLDLFESL